VSERNDSATRLALLDMWALLIPVVPFGLVYGVLVGESSTSTFWGWIASPLVMAGASQLTLVALIEEGTAVTSALLSAIIINSRHLMYSAAISPIFRPQPRWFRLVAPMFMVDQVFALNAARPDLEPAFRRRYWLVMSLTFWTAWVVTTSVGVLFGGSIPESWRIEFAVSILFMSIVVSAIRASPVGASPGVVAATTGFVVAAVAGPVPNQLGLMIGAFAGIAAGTITEVRNQ